MNNRAVEWAPLFPGAEIPHILAALIRCAERLKKESEDELENRLNDRLIDLLQQDAPLRRRPITVDREVSLYDLKRKTKSPIGRVDVRFLCSTGVRKPWPYFALECKRLHVSFPSGWKSLVSEYVTADHMPDAKKERRQEQGMMCFIEQRYAQGLDSGGMLGYVFDGKIDDAWKTVATTIEANCSKLQGVSPFRMVTSQIISGESRVGQTIHSVGDREFIIYHLFAAV